MTGFCDIKGFNIMINADLEVRESPLLSGSERIFPRYSISEKSAFLRDRLELGGDRIFYFQRHLFRKQTAKAAFSQMLLNLCSHVT